MSSKKLKLFIVGVSVAFATGILYFLQDTEREKPPDQLVRIRKEIYNYDKGVCPGRDIQVKLADPYMRGVFAEGESVEATLNYYACHEIKRGERVLYRYSEFDEPVVRRVVAAPNDRFELVNEKITENGWRLKVNGSEVTGIDGSKYVFGGKTPPPLALASEQRKGRLGPGEVIILSTWSPGDKDSSIFGVVALEDIVASVRPLKREKDQ